MYSETDIPLLDHQITNLDFWSDAVILLMACIGTMFLFYLIEHFLQKILEIMDYTDIHADKLPKGQYTRQVNIMSALITGALAVASYLEHGYFHKNISCDMIRSYQTDTHFLNIVVFISYLSYDVIFHKLSIEHYIHHFLAILLISVAFLSRNSYCAYFQSCGMLIELSSLPMNLIFLTSGITKNILMGIFALTFFIVRPVFMLMLLAEMIKCDMDNNLESFGFYIFACLYLLNLYWFVLICRKILRKFSSSKSS